MLITLILQIYLTTITKVTSFSLFCPLLGTKSGESFQQKEFCKQIEFVLITAWWHPVCQVRGGGNVQCLGVQTNNDIFNCISPCMVCLPKNILTMAMSSLQPGGTLFVRWGGRAQWANTGS